MSSYAEFYRRSLQDRERFWAEQAQLIEWRQQPRQIYDYSRPPFMRWFAGGTTNLCHNAVDRHLKDRPDQAALIYVSTETGEERTYSFRELHGEVACHSCGQHGRGRQLRRCRCERPSQRRLFWMSHVSRR